MNKILYLMQGVPGSGKSTVAEMIAKATDGVIYSTDALWYDDDGVYQFDKDKLGEMHRRNQKLVAEAMVEGKESIIVDNTNIDSLAVKPYVMLANIHDYDIQVVRVMCSFELAEERNQDRTEDRRVPDEIVKSMDQRMMDLSAHLGRPSHLERYGI